MTSYINKVSELDDRISSLECRVVTIETMLKKLIDSQHDIAKDYSKEPKGI